MTATSGRISPTPFAYYDPELSCWRTSQGTLALDLTPSSVTLPRSGSMRNGELFERPTLAHPIGANGCSSLLPTPRTTDANGSGLHGQGGPDLRTTVSLLPTPTASDHRDGTQLRASAHYNPATGGSHSMGLNPWAEAAHLLPTPTSRDGKGRNQRNDTTCLPGAVVELFPTPRATDGTKGCPAQRGSKGDLMLPSAVMQLLPTPTAADSSGSRNSTHQRPPGSTANIGDTLTDAVTVLNGARTRQPSSDGKPSSADQHPTPPPPGEQGDLF